MKRRSMWRAGRIAILAGMATAFAGCGDGPSEPANPRISGQWVGEAVFEIEDIPGEILIRATLQLSETGTGEVSGTFTSSVQGTGIMAPDLSGTVSGQHSYPNVSLILVDADLDEVPYSGQLVSEDRIRGILGDDIDAPPTVPLEFTRP